MYVGLTGFIAGIAITVAVYLIVKALIKRFKK